MTISDDEFNARAKIALEKMLKERAAANDNEMRIHLYDEAPLRIVSEPITEVTPTYSTLATQMLIFCRRCNGIGLAAPQIGVNKRIIVVVPDMFKTRYDEYLFNPVIKNPQGEVSFREGCLSVPKTGGWVKRYAEFDLEYLNYKGEPSTIHWKYSKEDYYGIIIQHEIDHLDAILYIDHLNFIDKDKVTKILNKRRKK